ncbi:MAG: phosphatase PAP2 family protein [Candidatus Aenigmarchaeota archaeon]|nr:phosphatase PAP2 family protein [Candidatus Aenigmarchaeota archaeon]
MLLNIDLTVVKLLNQQFLAPLNYLLIFVIYSVYGFLIFLVYFFFKTKKSNKLSHLFFTSVLGYVLVVSLKFLFARTDLGLLLGRPGNLRPYDVDPTINVIFKKTDPAFPSSHAFIAFLSFYFLPKKFRFKCLFAAYLLFLIPLASMCTGVHYPSDVIAGAVLGIIIPRIISEKITSRFVNFLSSF